jgi:FtsH-binding integral membrane protein
MKKQRLSFAGPLVFVFAFITAFCLTGRNWLTDYQLEPDVIIIGNLVLFAVSITAFWLTSRSFRSGNPQAFVRAMYGSFMVKFFVVAIVAFIYIIAVKKNVSKPSLAACGILYIVYTVLETRALTRLLKQKKNA